MPSPVKLFDLLLNVRVTGKLQSISASSGVLFLRLLLLASLLGVCGQSVRNGGYCAAHQEGNEGKALAAGSLLSRRQDRPTNVPLGDVWQTCPRGATEGTLEAASLQ